MSSCSIKSLLEPNIRGDVRFRISPSKVKRALQAKNIITVCYGFSEPSLAYHVHKEAQKLMGEKFDIVYWSCPEVPFAVEYRFPDNVPPEMFGEVIKAIAVMHEASLMRSGHATAFNVEDPILTTDICILDEPARIADLILAAKYGDLNDSISRRAISEWDEAFKEAADRLERKYGITEPVSSELFTMNKRFREEAGLG